MDYKRPKEKIHPKAIKAWRVGGCIYFAFYIFIIIGFIVSSRLWGPFPNFILWILMSLAIVLGLLNIFIIPSIRKRYWCYEIKEYEVDIQYGILVVKRSLIPMAKIQHVDTEQGPILRYFQLATLSISTAGTNHKIPALKMEKALELRKQISTLARINDEEI
ncbi:PH domain-containing protein [Proteinivorax tanatarense]|uniref:PH domain-containing protein n=1 Tax=Proteinivorax tanatarense TaxID=1260629 RepID=A0AAU7VJP3_9FIRM